MIVKDYLEYGILGILILLSIIVLALILERIYTFKKIDYLGYCDRKMLEIDLTKNLTLIATIGTNAPYIGLLGTIGGIMLTFIEIGNSNIINSQAIMTGLALALKATALGLIVAIPAIVGYNLLLRKSEVLLMKWDIESSSIDYNI
ncbi:TonB-system energizer ExbB [Helicobacter sp. MIT 14-3879]|uniref:TonB-system energizer ExbB n=1 Tax=Helicobacter sp. MIT 14-3879 TaxID=2040649 RepID=UPI000E1E64A7|nr:TonB-system energizer ExbB [Helicobacter sp. MIT 14-3879]RDU64822.1 TonB-system energizer ExbB [Helicobacter sp. MIT 14-3879]